MTNEVHFVQGDTSPILAGSGNGTLFCDCGNALIQQFQPAQFLGVAIRCGRCGNVTTTPPLAPGEMPPASLITAEPSTQPRFGAMTVPAKAALIGRTEMQRLGDLLRPATPAEWVYHLSADTLDQVAATFEQHVGGTLPKVFADPADPFVGVAEHALSWSVRHLRTRLRDANWACMQDAPTANAVTHVSGFLHFAATWSRHPLFPAMAATANKRGCSLHGLALFAAAHALAMMGNRIGFQPLSGSSNRVDRFDLATGPTEVVSVHMDVFDLFEFPFQPAWDPVGLQSAVTAVVAEAQSRINLRNPGLLLLSPGSALPGYDEALIEAAKTAVRTLGRKNRGLMAVAPVTLRLQAVPDPHAVRLCYGLFPLANRHYSGTLAATTP